MTGSLAYFDKEWSDFCRRMHKSMLPGVYTKHFMYGAVECPSCGKNTPKDKPCLHCGKAVKS